MGKRSFCLLQALTFLTFKTFHTNLYNTEGKEKKNQKSTIRLLFKENLIQRLRIFCSHNDVKRMILFSPT